VKRKAAEHQYVTSLETARILGCAPDNVRQLARAGKLPVALLIGPRHTRLFDRHVVEEFRRKRRLAADEAKRRSREEAKTRSRSLRMAPATPTVGASPEPEQAA
jgi:hypothetical protein